MVAHYGTSDCECSNAPQYVIPAVPVDEPEQPFRHAHVEEEVDRVVGAASTSEDDRGSARVARNLFEPGGTEQRRDVVRLGEREHARSARQPAELGQLDVLTDRIRDERQPLVRGETLPGHECGPAPGTQRPSDVGERRHGVVEEHQPELADDQIERAGVELVSLRVSDHELGVADPRVLRATPCQFDERLRKVDTGDASGAGGGGQRRRARSAADIEHHVVCLGPCPFQECLGEGLELTVVAVGVVDEVR